eukprot:XP_001703152.1 predicted protein [Chlamydomonas reinhardtii]
MAPQRFCVASYAPYMAWRGVQYFFGGAISVFTTQSLLGALGVAGRYSGEAAAAINWVIKDGAGRLGRLLFARWGRELDCELKQFRLMGYLVASRKEVDSVELPYMNRARLAYAARQYLTGGQVPGVAEANHHEPLLPWGRYNQGRLVLGASVEAACAAPADLLTAAAAFREGPYLASFFGHVFLHILDGHHLDAHALPLPAGFRQGLADTPSTAQLADFASVTTAVVSALYPDFLAQAERNGWKLQQTMLNPKENRLLKLSVPLQTLRCSGGVWIGLAKW